MRTPNELYKNFDEIRIDAIDGIINLMSDHNVTSLNTEFYMNDLGFDYVDISVYDRKLDAMFYDPVNRIVLDEDGLHLFSGGESDCECYEPSTVDWMNVYSLVYDIFTAVDSKQVELYE